MNMYKECCLFTMDDYRFSIIILHIAVLIYN